MRVGLRRRRRVGRNRSAQVAETRHGDGAEAAVDQRGREVQPLVMAAAGAMHDQYRRAVAHCGVLDRAAARLDDLTAMRDAPPRTVDIAAEACKRPANQAGD